MGEEALVESQISGSIELIKQLDSSGYQPSLAVWYYYDDADEWRFIIAGTEFDKYLPKQEPLAYLAVAKAINAKDLSSISISHVKLVRTDEPLVTTVKRVIGTPPTAIVNSRFVDNWLNGIFIKEMVVLRSA